MNGAIRGVVGGVAAGLAAVGLGFATLTMLVPVAAPPPAPPAAEAPQIAALTSEDTPAAPPHRGIAPWVALYAQAVFARSDASGNGADLAMPRPAPAPPDPGPALLGPPGVGNRPAAPLRVATPVEPPPQLVASADPEPQGEAVAAASPPAALVGGPPPEAPTPVASGSPVIEAQTAASAPEDAVDEDAPPAPSATAAPEVPTPADSEPSVVEAQPPVPTAPGDEEEPQTPDAPETTTAADPPAPPVTGRLPQIAAAAEPEGDDRAEPAAAPPAGAEVVTARLPQVTVPAPEAMPGASSASATATLPAPRLPSRARLPQIGVEAAAADAGAEPDTVPAWQLHRAVPLPGDRPALGIVLLDAGPDPETEAALADFPIPLTLALDPFDPDAPRRAALYRAAGHEVALALSGIAPGATAADVEVILESWSRDFPQALALAELPPLGGREARALAPALVPALQARGLALIAPDRGLSPLLTAARAQGLPAVGLYRALDTGDEDAAAIRRLLDRAAFEAERSGGAALWGRADRAETRAALIDWMGTARAGRVATGAGGTLLPAP